MRTGRIIHIARQVGALAVAALTAASTVNGYRLLARHGYPSMTLASQIDGLALTSSAQVYERLAAGEITGRVVITPTASPSQ